MIYRFDTRSMLQFDFQQNNRVTMKLDVSYTDHSHIIGKGGLTIKRVMEETGCHIHFPDSNRSNHQDKSNQVSIAGEMGSVERARARVRVRFLVQTSLKTQDVRPGYPRRCTILMIALREYRAQMINLLQKQYRFSDIHGICIQRDRKLHARRYYISKEDKILFLN